MSPHAYATSPSSSSTIGSTSSSFSRDCSSQCCSFPPASYTNHQPTPRRRNYALLDMDCRRHKLGMQSADSIFSHSTFLNDNLAQKVTRMRTLPLAQLRILNITSLFVFLYLTCFATPVAASSKISIKATGASFPNDIYQKLIRQFMSIHGASAISSFDYIGDTSTAGLATQNVNMSYQFGGSDIAVDPRVYNQSTLIALPAVAGAIAVAFNIPEITRIGNSTHAPTLRISRTALPSIFDGTIKYWNDTRILGDNEPDVRRVLSTINEPIQLVVRNRGSGTSANFIRYCKMVKESFVEWTGVPGLKVIAAKTNQAVGQIVGSIPYTITYMDREELESSKTSRDRSEPPLAAYVQNQRLQYVFPDRSSLTSTIRNLSEDTLQSWNPNNRTLELLDSTADNAYPISIVSNYIIRKNNISTSVDISAWTLRYMWWTLFSLESEEIFNATHFVSLRSSQASTLSLNILRGYTQNNQKLYNASICDMAADGVNPCVHGKCTTRLPFQSDDVKCVCEPGFQNLHYTDCREIQPVFASNDPMVIVQLILAGIAVIVITTIWGLVIFHRNHPKIRAISPVCCYVILGGCLCGGISIVGYAATPTDLVCRMRIFWPAAGFGAVFGMLLLKTYRIYTIFGYNRLKTSRGIRDIILVHLTLAITALEVLLSGLQILFSRPRGKDKAFDGALFTVCAAGERLEGVSVAMEIVVYACNAVLLVVALWLAVKTRGAFRRFAESKAIGMVIYVVTICVCMGLPVLYAIPILSPQTNAVVNMVRAVLFFILATGTPLILFARRLGEVLGRASGNTRPVSRNETEAEGRNGDKTSLEGSGERWMEALGVWEVEGTAEQEEEETRVVEGLEGYSYMFEVGICRNRFGAAWAGAKLLLLPHHDILFFVDSMRSAETLASMRISSTLVSSPNWGEDSNHSSSSHHPVQSSVTPDGFIVSTDDDYQKRMVMLVPVDDRAGWFVEFWDLERVKVFKRVVRGRMGGEMERVEGRGDITLEVLGNGV